MAKPRVHSPRVSQDVYNYLRKPPKDWAAYVVSDRQDAQSRIRGKDISAKVDRAAGPDLAPEREKAVEYGYSGEVSRGKRPVHKAGKRSYKRV